MQEFVDPPTTPGAGVATARTSSLHPIYEDVDPPATPVALHVQPPMTPAVSPSKPGARTQNQEAVGQGNPANGLEYARRQNAGVSQTDRFFGDIFEENSQRTVSPSGDDGGARAEEGERGRRVDENAQPVHLVGRPSGMVVQAAAEGGQGGNGVVAGLEEAQRYCVCMYVCV